MYVFCHTSNFSLMCLLKKCYFAWFFIIIFLDEKIFMYNMGKFSSMYLYYDMLCKTNKQTNKQKDNNPIQKAII
jgi:hypothetical protein